MSKKVKTTPKKKKLLNLETMSSDEVRLSSVLKYFKKNKTSISEMMPILKGESKISLRILDWFVTNYSKKYNIIYDVDGDLFHVHLEYKEQLKAKRKGCFDPFCRGSRINFYFTENDYIVTTLGQLNFFKWAIKNNIIGYVNMKYDEIFKDMNESSQANTKKKAKKTEKPKRKKRQELSVSATKTVNKHYVKILLEFD